MPQPQLRWSDLLDEEAYLVQMVSETPLDPGALEQISVTLEVLGTELGCCMSEVADLDGVMPDNNPDGLPPKWPLDPRPSRTIDCTNPNERLVYAVTRKRMLVMEIKNLEVKAQVLRHRIRHYDELMQRLKILYERSGLNSSSPEEAESEEAVRKTRTILHQNQMTMELYKTIAALIDYGGFALSRVFLYLSATSSKENKDNDPAAFQAELIGAQACAIQADIVVDQAKRLDPVFFGTAKGGEVFQTNWLPKVFPQRSVCTDNTQGVTQISSQQVLKSYQATLLSLLALAHKRLQDNAENLRRAVQRHGEACRLKHAIRRRFLLNYAGIEDDQLSIEKHNTGRSRIDLVQGRDITDELDTLIVSGVPPAPRDSQGRTSDKGQPERNPSNTTHNIVPWSTETIRLSPKQYLFQENLGPASKRSSVSTVQRCLDGAPEATSICKESLPSHRPGQNNPRLSLNRGIEEPQYHSHVSSSDSGDSRARGASSSSHILSGTQTRQQTPPTSAQVSIQPRKLLSQSPSNKTLSQDVSPHSDVSRYEPMPSESSTSIMQPPKRTRGILTAPTVSSRPSATDLTDMWGVKIAAVGPSRRHKLKDMVGRLRENSKSNVDVAPPVPPKDEASQSGLKTKWTTVQTVRFSHEVEIIPRPAVDSDLYEDENNVITPPSPTRRTFCRLSMEDVDESEETIESRLTELSPYTHSTQISSSPSFLSEGHNLHSLVHDALESPPLHAPSSSSHSPRIQTRHITSEDTDNTRWSIGVRDLHMAPLVQPKPIHPIRAFSELETMAADDMCSETRLKTRLGLPAGVRGLAWPSDPSLPASLPIPRGLESRSDHDLVRRIFPSPRSTIEEHVLSFTN